ncbi:MAG: hypothetical protein LBJ72_05145 [Dysgonamonadaceae bacterium]|jgi:hypothetical protein|nr:hypothetical protein [Dysgonamonadaceae bacterium]
MEKRKIITIMVMVDVVGVLSNDSLEKNLYLYDNNKANGSFGHGTEKLTTRLIFNPDEEIMLLWNVLPIEPETFVHISQVVADKKYLKIEQNNYKESDIIYWTGTFIRKPVKQLSYKLSIRVGNRETEFSFHLDLVCE